MPLFINSNRLESEISRRASAACEQIESEIGAEIHDELVQKLSVFRLYLEQVERASMGHAEIENLVIEMRSDFDHIIRSVRNISRRLLPVRMDGDSIVNMMAALCQDSEMPGLGYVHFENLGIPQNLESHVERYLIRIVQELIQNAFKHSSAWHIWVRMRWDKNELTIEVEDDGSGFSRIEEYIVRLKKRHNTLRMRTKAISANIDYLQGKKGLLALLSLPLADHNSPLRNA